MMVNSEEVNVNIKSDPGVCMINLTAYAELLNEKDALNQKAKILIKFTKLRYSVPCGRGKSKEILRDVSGCFRPGRLTAILGPSGAGKTTLLSILSGQRTSDSGGSIFVNGVNNSFLALRKKCCYVPQEFALMSLLTVKETLLIAAQLKLPRPHTPEFRESKVNEVIDKLGLNDSLDTIAEKLSGGERKRLSIGVEVITNPSMMFLDEPTSGLDSAASKQVINLLHSSAETGCTIACAVHQPSSQLISQFDDILVLKQGECCYSGSRSEILEVFKEAGFSCPNFYNIAEFVLEVVTGQRGSDLSGLHIKQRNISLNESRDTVEYRNGIIEENYESYSSEGDKSPEFSSKLYPASNWIQFTVLLKRAFICIKRDNKMTELRFAAHLIVALLLGSIFYKFGEDANRIQSNIACLFFIVLFLFFANSMPAVQMFPSEAAVFVRENSNNWYTLHSYYIAKIISDLPMQILCPSSFLFIVYFLTDQPPEVLRFSQTWIICILITILAQSFGIATGAAFNIDAGMFLVPALNIPMFLFAGFFLKLSEIPHYLRPFSAISFFRYGFEGLLQAVYGSDRPTIRCLSDNEFCITQSPRRILKQLDMPSMSYQTINLILIGWILSLHLTIYLVLQRKLKIATK